jgi:hypothetical protein
VPKLNGKDPKVLQGERNPRHFIMIPVGTGNQYCCNCEHLATALNTSACRVFKETLTVNHRLGPERCAQCREAEKLIQTTKEAARKKGEDTAFYKSQEGEQWRRGSNLGIQALPSSR